MIKRILVMVLVVVLLLPCSVEAKTVVKYTTPGKVALRDKAKGKAIIKVKCNTKLIILKKGKVWSKVQYKDQEYFIKNKWLNSQNSPKKYTRKKFKRAGRIHWRGKSWTWYTQRILPGRGLRIPGRHLDKNGFVCDKNDYIVLASSIGYKKQRKILPTPFGKFGKVYDTNGTWNYNWRDVYTNW